MPRPDQYPTHTLDAGKLQQDDMESFITFRDTLLSIVRTDSKMAPAVITITHFSFPEEILNNCVLDNNTWIHAPGAIDPSDPTQHLRTAITYGDVARSAQTTPRPTKATTPTSSNAATAAIATAKIVYDACIQAGLTESQALQLGKRSQSIALADSLSPVVHTPKKQKCDTPHVTPHKQLSPLRRRSDDSHTNTFISADVYNTTVEKLALREVAEYLSAIPSIIGIMLNHLSLRTRAALQSNTTWTAATLRRDLVCAWYTLIDVALFSSTSRSRHIHNIQQELQSEAFHLRNFNDNLLDFNIAWANKLKCLQLCDPNYQQTLIVQHYASAVVQTPDRDIIMLFNSDSLHLIDTTPHPSLVTTEARNDLLKAQQIFQQLWLLSTTRSKPKQIKQQQPQQQQQHQQQHQR